MIKNRKKFKSVLLIFCAVLLSVLIEIIFFNGIKMHNIGNNKGTFSLNEYTEIETEKINVSVNETKNDNVHSILDMGDKELNYEQKMQENEEVNNYVTKEVKKIKIKFEKMYIDRLALKYVINENTQMNAKYISFDEYGNPAEEELNLTFLKDFNTITRVIQKEVDYIEIVIDSRDNINLIVDDISVKNEFCFNVYRFILISLFLVSFTFIYIFRQTVLNKIEYLFIIIALCTGISQIILIPCLTFYSWDDHIHLERIYSLFEKGEIDKTKAFNYSYGLKLEIGNIPTSYEEFNMISDYLNDNNVNDGKIINENKFISYDNFTYIPSSIAVYLCKIFKAPYTLLFHMGKLANFLVYIVIMFYAIKHAKVGKKILFVLALLPSTIFLAAQYSRDAIITAGIYLAISTFLNCYCTDEKMNRKNLLIFIFSILIASLSKAIYVPFLLLIILMPKNKFENSKNSKWIKLLVILLLLLAMSTFIFPAVSSSASDVSDIRGGNTSVGGQMQLIMSQPVSFIKVFGKYLKEVITSKIISNMTLANWHNFVVINSEKYLLLLLIIVFAAAFTEKKEKKYKIDLKLKVSLLLISLLIICLICGSMYLSFTTVGSTSIVGVQERYYIPLLFAIFISLKNSKFSCKIKDHNITLIITIVLFYIYFFEIYNSIFKISCI